MKADVTRHLFVARLAALALAALCLLQAQVLAQGMATYIVIFPSVGLAPGQSLRLTLFNPDGTPLRAQGRVHTSGLNVVFADGSTRFVPGDPYPPGFLGGVNVATIRAGAFHSFDLPRDDVFLPGEARTGRLQLQPSLFVVADPGKRIDGLTVSMETVSLIDGTSNTLLFGEKFPAKGHNAGNDFLNSAFGNDVMEGIARNQTLRITALNPPSFPPAGVGSHAHRLSISGHAMLFDSSGNAIAQSEDITLAPGEARSVDFKRADLPFSAEPGERLQVRARLIWAKLQRKREFPASVELVDESTGRTTALAGHECLVFFLGGMPE
jgi:prepilin-type processing-associated H-X9-DG protein